MIKVQRRLKSRFSILHLFRICFLIYTTDKQLKLKKGKFFLCFLNIYILLYKKPF